MGCQMKAFASSDNGSGNPHYSKAHMKLISGALFMSENSCSDKLKLLALLPEFIIISNIFLRGNGSVPA